MKRLLSLLFATILVSIPSMGQDEGVITLYGHISDRETSESLYYSSVNLGETSISIVSNSEGYFALKVPESTSPDARVIVSHLGYQTASLPVSAFSEKTAENPLKIRLNSSSLHLDAATIRVIDPDGLVRSAFFKVKDNYPGTRVGMTAFYREMTRKGSVKYLALNEAVLDIDKAPYSGFFSDKVGIYKGRGCINYDASDSLAVKCQGGVITMLQLDQVRNSFAGLYFDEALVKYAFSLNGVVSYDGYNFYKIGFKPKFKEEDEILFSGFVYIETESLAIGRVEMEMNLAGREEEASKIFVIKRPQNTRFYINKAQYVMTYKCFDGLWYYDYCRSYLNFSTRNKNSLFKKNFSVTGEMAVTDHKDGGIAIEPANRLKFKDILSDKVSDFADDSFWGEYNIIEPDQSIETVIKKIVRKLSSR